MNYAAGWALGASVTIMALGLGIIAPALPLFGRTFGVGAALVGSLVSVYALGRLVLDVPGGLLVDRVGRRPVLLGSAAMVVVTATLAGTAGSFPQLVLWRFLQGMGSGLFTTSAMVAMADLGGPIHRARALSVFSGAFLIGSSLGPSVGGLVTAQYGPRAPFLVYAGLGALAFLWVFRQVPETAAARAHSPQSDRAESAPPFPYRDFALVGLVTFAVFFTRAGGRATILPLFAYNQLGASATQVGLMLSSLAIMNMVVLYPTGALSDRFGRKFAIVPSVLLMALSFVLMSRATSYPGLLAGVVLLGIGSGIGGPAPAAYVADLGPPDRIGAAMGLYRAIGDLGFFIGPLAMGWVADASGYRVALASIAGLLLVAILPFALFAREHSEARAIPRVQPAFNGRTQEAPAGAADE